MARVVRLSKIARVAVFGLIVIFIGLLLLKAAPSSYLDKVSTKDILTPQLIQQDKQPQQAQQQPINPKAASAEKAASLGGKAAVQPIQEEKPVSLLDMDNVKPEAPKPEKDDKEKEKKEYFGLPVPMYAAISNTWPLSSTSSWANSRLANILKRKKQQARKKNPDSAHIQDSTPIVQVSPVVKNLKPVLGSKARYFANLKKQQEKEGEQQPQQGLSAAAPKEDGFNVIWTEGQVRRVMRNGNEIIIDESEFAEMPERVNFQKSDDGAFAALDDAVDWSKYAYVQYVTNAVYLCNAVMIFEQLERLGARAQRVLLYPSEWDEPGFFETPVDPAGPLPEEAVKDDGTNDRQDQEEAKLREGAETGDAQKQPEEPKLRKRDVDDSIFDQKSMAHHTEYLLKLAVMKYNVVLRPIATPKMEAKDVLFSRSFSKFSIFNQTEFDRVLYLDSDGSVLHNMDHLFLLPKAPIAATKAYWVTPSGNDKYNGLNPQAASFFQLNTQLELIEPSKKTFNYIMRYLGESTNEANSKLRSQEEYETEVFNKLFKDEAMVIPHKGAVILTGELRNEDATHRNYVGKFGTWDARAIFNDTLYVHFSDHPHPKPWIRASGPEIRENTPKCAGGESVCPERAIWLYLYHDYETRRNQVCQMPMMFFDKESSKYFTETANWNGASSAGGGARKSKSKGGEPDSLYQALLEEERLQEEKLLREQEEEEKLQEANSELEYEDEDDEPVAAAAAANPSEVEEQDRGEQPGAAGQDESGKIGEQEREQRNKQELQEE